jgi:hypothetical protein
MDTRSTRSAREVKDEMLSSAESYLTEDDPQPPTKRKNTTGEDSSASSTSAGGTKKKKPQKSNPVRQSARQKKGTNRYLYTSKYDTIALE